MKKSITIYNHSIYFKEYVKDLVKYLARDFLVNEESNSRTASSSDILIVINPLKNAYPRVRSKQLLVGIQTEQYYNSLERGRVFNYKKKYSMAKVLKKYHLLYDWNPTLYQIYSAKYKKIRFLPHSNLDAYSKYNQTKKPKKYDLIFFGNNKGIDNRRKKILDTLSEKYSFHPFSSNLSDQNYWGKDKFSALQESLISINIHFDHSASFESPRFYESIAMGAVVLSEFVYNSYPFESGVDFIETPLERWVETIDSLIRDKKQIEEIVLNSKRKLNQFPSSKQINRVSKEIFFQHDFHKTKNIQYINFLKKKHLLLLKKLYSKIFR